MITSFLGCSEFSVDNKGRVSIPVEFRHCLYPEAENTFIIVRSYDDALRAYPYDIWQKFEKKIMVLPETEEIIKSKRLLFMSLTKSTLDSQGRITLSENQRLKAGIDKSVILYGMGDSIEIWASNRFNEYQNNYKEFQEKLPPSTKEYNEAFRTLINFMVKVDVRTDGNT
ncbi:MAG: hypothetical protein N2053_04075 [Chitinispirillaceae bacterium]|nr:hypothetical protein [Chitinispirillaceae bacterium]